MSRFIKTILSILKGIGVILLSILGFILSIVTLLFVESLWFTSLTSHYRSATTFQAALQLPSDKYKFYRFELDSTIYYQMRLPDIRFVPSGPPIFIYNDSGVMVDSTFDIGDDSFFRDRWGKVVWKHPMLSDSELDSLRLIYR